jgi:TP901 family phage tail tape measure protein
VAEVAKGIIDIEINTGSAAQQLKALQQQINAFMMSLNSGARDQAQFAAKYSKDLQFAINKTGAFTAETVKLSTAAATLDKNLSKGKVTLGQFFSAKFNKNSAIAAETMALAAERAKRMQTQFIATTAAAKGFQGALAVRPLTELSSQMAIASERTQLMSTMFKQGTTQLINFGKNVQWAGRQLMVGFTVPLTIFGNTAAKTFSDLEQAAIRFKRVYGDIFTTEDQTAAALKGVEDLAKSYTKYNIAVKDTINLAADLAAAGYQGIKLNEAIAQTNRLATLGNIDQQKSMNTIISLQNAFQISTKELSGTIDYLNSVENQTIVSLDDITEAIPRVAPVIKGLGGDVKDLTVFLAAMEEGGVSAEQGANALKSGLASLINPTKTATQTLAGFGINLNQIVETNKGDLMGTVTGLAQALSTLSDFQKQQSIEAIFGKYQFARLGSLFTNIIKEGGQANKVLQLASQSAIELAYTANKELRAVEDAVSNKFKKAIEDLKVAIAPIGEIFLKVSIPILNFIGKIVDKFNGLSEGKKQFIAIATIITGIVIPAGTMFFGLLMNLVGTLLKLSQGFGAFTKGFLTGGPIGAIKALSQSSKYLSLAEIDAAMAAQQLSVASEAVNAAFIEQVGAAGAAQGAINGLNRAYMDLIATQLQASRLPGFATAGRAMQKAKGYNSGVISVPGSGNRDTVPAMLTPGEAVIPAPMAQKYAPLITGMISGNIPGYVDGFDPSRTYQSQISYNAVERYIEQKLSSRLDLVAQAFESIPEDVKITLERFRSAVLEIDPNANRVGQQSGMVFAHATPSVPMTRAQMEQIASQYPESAVSRGLSAATSAVGFSNYGFYTPEKFNRGQYTGTQGAEYFSQFSDVAFSGMKMGLDESVQSSTLWNDWKNNLISELNLVGDSLVDDNTFYTSVENSLRTTLNNAADKAEAAIFQESMSSRRETITTVGAFGGDINRGSRGQRIPIPGMGSYKNTSVQQQAGEVRALEASAFRMVDSVEEATARAQQSSSPAERSAQLGDEWSRGYGQGIIRSGENAANAAEETIRMVDRRASQQIGALSGTPTITPSLPPGLSLPPTITASPEMIQGQLTGKQKFLNTLATPFARMINGRERSKMMAAGATPEELLASEELTKAKNKEAQATSTFGSKIFTASLAATTLGAAMSTAEGGIGEIGQKIMQFSSGVSVVSGLLPMLKSPMGALTLTVGMAVAAYKLHNDAVKQSAANIRKAAMEQANAMTGSAKTVAEFAKATGALSLQSRRAQRNLTNEQSTAYYQALTGGDMAETMSTYEAARREGSLVNVVSNDIAVLSAAFDMTSKDIQGYIDAVAAAMEDPSLRIKIRADLIEMIYDDGKVKEDLLKNPRIPIDFQAELKKKGPTAVSDFLTKNAVKDIKNNNFANMLTEQQKLFAQGQQRLAGTGIEDLRQAGIAQQFAKDMESKSGFSKYATLASEGIASIFGKQAALNMSAYSQKNDGGGSLAASVLAPTAMGLTAGAGIGALFGGIGAVPGAAIGAIGGGLLGLANYGKDQLLGPSQEDIATAANYYNIIMQKSAEASNILTKSAEQNQMAQEALNMAYESGSISLETYRQKSKEISENTKLINDGLQQQIDILKTQGPEALAEFAAMSNEAFDIKIDASALPDAIKERLKAVFDEFEGDPEMQIKAQMAFTESGMSAEQFLLTMNELKTMFPEEGDKQLRLDIITSMVENNISMDKISEYTALLNALPPEVRSKFILDGQITPQAAMAFALASLTPGSGNSAYREGYATQENMMQRAQKYIESLMYTPGVDETGGKNPDDKDGSGSGSGGAKNWLDYLMNRFELVDKRLAAQIQQYQDVIDLQERQNELDQRTIDLNQRGLDQLSKQEDALNKRYDERISLLDGVAESNSRLKEQEASRISLAKALAEGNVSTAAQIMSQMTANEANYRIEDTRAALEKQKEEDIKNLKVEINGQLLTREQIESNIDAIEENIYQRNLKVRDAQDQIYNLEQQRLANSREREKIETKLYMLEQRKAILELQRMKVGKGGLTKEQAGFLSEYKQSYNTMVDYFNSTFGESLQRVMYGGMIKKFAIGGNVPGKGNIDRVPALLTPGEFVVRKSAAQANMPLLEMINNGVFPKLGGPSYNVPDSSVGVGSTSVTNSVMYNDTYNINVNVAGTSASPEDIANVVMAKLSQTNRGNVRSIRY